MRTYVHGADSGRYMLTSRRFDLIPVLAAFGDGPNAQRSDRADLSADVNVRW